MAMLYFLLFFWDIELDVCENKVIKVNRLTLRSKEPIFFVNFSQDTSI